MDRDQRENCMVINVVTVFAVAIGMVLFVLVAT
jgi:hypothetical protein